MTDPTPAAGELTEADELLRALHGVTWKGEPVDAAVERIIAARTEAADRELARVTAAVEALADDLCDFNPGHGDFLTAGKSLRAALSSAGSDLLDRERAKAAGEALREAADDVLLDESAGDYGTHVWLKRRAAAVSPEGLCPHGYGTRGSLVCPDCAAMSPAGGGA